MSESNNTKIEKKFDLDSWLQETADVMLNADKTQLDEIQRRLQTLLKRSCSQSECDSRETKARYNLDGSLKDRVSHRFPISIAL